MILLRKNLPRARGKPELFPGITSQFNLLNLGPEWALDFTEHIRRQEPIIGVHMALFNDATLISIRWAHVNIGSVPPKEPCYLADTQLSPQAFKKTFETYLEHVTLSCRGSIWTSSAAIVWINLKPFQKEPSSTEHLFSDADILAAWAARLCCGIHPSVDRPVHVMSMYEARHCLPETFPHRKDNPDSSPVFIANATFSTSTNITLRALRQQPLARTALLVRESVAMLTKASQVHAQLHLLQEAYAKDKENPPVFAAQDAFILVVSNFSTMGFFGSIDFSPAVITPAANGHGKSWGKIAWH
ncbi:lysr family regulatory [Fusarium mundagurra]|uniref:Lysr family regulatory n=1 Tax=Fusarium mundagurra TaxID=1567541 RepID=A0A8H5YAH1_9HYPO|nr:lysr family regulatory [Fusarium mundagurra]